MICFDSDAAVFAVTVEIFANPTSERRALHHLSMRMIANTLLSVGTPRAALARGRRGKAGNREDSHHFPGLDELGLRAREILRRFLFHLEAA